MLSFAQSPFSCEEALPICNPYDSISIVFDNITDSGISYEDCGGFTNEFFFESAIWLQYIFKAPGKFTFTLHPRDGDDLDFIIMRPEGGKCTNLVAARCMFSGSNLGDPEGSLPCLGDTGCRIGEEDEVENPGCTGEDNNFLKPIDMGPGDTLYLVVRNFSINGSTDFGLTHQNPSIISCTNVSTSTPFQSTPILFPNPTTDFLNVSDGVQIDRIIIFDSEGNEVHNTPWDKEKINMSSLRSGLYFCQLHYRGKLMGVQGILKI